MQVANLLQPTSGMPLPGAVVSAEPVLIVDDSPQIRRALRAILIPQGFVVIDVRSGEEALQLLAVQPVDCILLDVLMPGIGGQETCRRVKGVPVTRDIPIVMLTAHGSLPSAIAAVRCNVADYLLKPIDIERTAAR